jgi:hypothetical protein
MNLQEQNAALQSRISLAKHHWNLFFSQMPVRPSNFPTVPDAPQINAGASPIALDIHEGQG